MKKIMLLSCKFLMLLLILTACSPNIPKPIPVPIPVIDTIIPVKTYSNERFRNVTVERIGVDTFLVKGQGQLFEAVYSWVIEDGHNELAQGHGMADAGGPEWGNFVFGVKAQKERENSTLTLVIFEASAKDGSRQYQLPITLY